MRILVYTNHYWPENFRITDVAEDLVYRGHDVTVLTGIPNYPGGKFYSGYGVFKNARESRNGVKIRRIPLIPRGSGSSFRLILNYISSTISFCMYAPIAATTHYDVVLVFATSPSTIGIPAVITKKLRRVPVIFWVLDLWPESISATASMKDGFLLKGIRRVMRWIYRNSDLILTSSKGFELNIRSLVKLKPRIRYFPNWVEPSSEQATIPDPCPSIPNGFRILFTGNVGVAQDFETILDAAERLKNFDAIHWVIVGEGRRLSWVQQEIVRRNLSRNFHCLGQYPSSTMSWFYQQCDALLLPLRDQAVFALTAPGKLQPYMASGKPIIASLPGEGADIVRDAGCGICNQPSNPENLAESVLSLYHMPLDQREKMGDNGRKYCITHFTRKTLFDELESELLGFVAGNAL